jgi:Ca2+-transporting ATPase
MEAWHTLAVEAVEQALKTHAHDGLSVTEAERRLLSTGPNALRTVPPPPAWRIFLDQFRDFMVLVLLVATAISFVLGETGDALTIVAIVVMNAILGFVQEYRAERSVATLKALTAPTAKVIREGRLVVEEAWRLVPGDVVWLEAGDRVPADLRLVEAWALEVDEAALTGESHPVAKTVRALEDPRLPLAERSDMAYMGTAVTRGRGRGIVVATGMETEVGRIAGLLESAEDEPTPLQRRLEHLGRILVGLSLGIVLAVVAAGIWRGEPLYAMFLTGVSLAVAAIPEGLPAIVTVALALGVQRMIRAHAIVRRLPAVETLGCTTVIGSDKTGTLTRNQMTVMEVMTAAGRWSRRRDGGFVPERGQDRGDFELALTIGVLASSAVLTDDHAASPDGLGDPTELALLRAGAEAGVPPQATRARFERWGEIPFEAERRRMTVAVRDQTGRHWAYVKGAPDTILALARFIHEDGRMVPLDAGRRQWWQAEAERMAGQALRVMAVAYRPLVPGETVARWESDLILVGLFGLMDPPRPEAVEAVRECRRAGIRTVMITGDHPATALAVAREMGLLQPGQDRALTGRELDALDDAALDAIVDEVAVYARVAPSHKLRVVRALKRRGHVVAMTGDGVNDAPALKEADIGVAMGLTGTDVTKEAAAMILTDDNFATIVRAVREGRAIYDNIRKFVRYLLSCNVGEVLVMFLAAVLALPLPLVPIQILFVNLVTDGLPALALGVDPPAPGVMDRPPREPGEHLFARGLGAKIAWRGVLIGSVTLGVFAWALGPGSFGLREARTLALVTLVLSQLFHVFDARTEDRNFLEVGLFSNPWVVAAVLTSIAMLLAVVYVPALSRLFRTDPLTGGDWAVAVVASGFIQIAAAVQYLLAPGSRPAQAAQAADRA